MSTDHDVLPHPYRSAPDDPQPPGGPRFLVLIHAYENPPIWLRAILDPLTTQRRIAGWRHDASYPVHPLRAYDHPDFERPDHDIQGWIDGHGRIVPVAWPAEGGVPVFFRDNLSGLAWAAAGYRPGAYVTAAWIWRPAFAVPEPGWSCSCGHHPDDHPYCDCTGHDRSGLLCGCGDYQPGLANGAAA